MFDREIAKNRKSFKKMAFDIDDLTHERLEQLSNAKRQSISDFLVDLINKCFEEGDALSRVNKAKDNIHKEDCDIEILVESIKDLGKFRQRDTVPRLIELLRHPEKVVRNSSAAALELIFQNT